MSTKMGSNVNIQFYFSDPVTNRKRLFEDALSFATVGKVLYIMHNEIDELPQLSQDLSSVNKHYMKMISFLYAKTLESLIESISSLPNWQHTPSTVILDDLTEYCPKEKLQNACAIVALLLDTLCSCSNNMNVPCRLRIAINGNIGEHYWYTLQELYCATNR